MNLKEIQIKNYKNKIKVIIYGKSIYNSIDKCDIIWGDNLGSLYFCKINKAIFGYNFKITNLFDFKDEIF